MQVIQDLIYYKVWWLLKKFVICEGQIAILFFCYFLMIFNDFGHLDEQPPFYIFY
jgi:hypothetical protein